MSDIAAHLKYTFFEAQLAPQSIAETTDGHAIRTNVRKVAASASDYAELLASIRETDIKQNLVVHALSETRFAVDAGGRNRLKDLKHLA